MIERVARGSFGKGDQSLFVDCTRFQRELVRVFIIAQFPFDRGERIHEFRIAGAFDNVLVKLFGFRRLSAQMQYLGDVLIDKPPAIERVGRKPVHGEGFVESPAIKCDKSALQFEPGEHRRCASVVTLFRCLEQCRRFSGRTEPLLQEAQTNKVRRNARFVDQRAVDIFCFAVAS